MEVIANLTKEINCISLKLDVDTFLPQDKRTELLAKLDTLVAKRKTALSILEPPTPIE